MAEARLTFLATLRAGLHGVPALTVDDIVRDYASHFDVGAAQGRSDEEIATALGDPIELAKELRLDARMESFDAAPSLASAARVIGAVMTLGAVNAALAFIALPAACLFLFAALVALVAIFAVGLWFLFAGASLGFGWIVAALAGVGLVLAAIAIGAGLALLAVWIVGGIGRYARMHQRALPRRALVGAP